MCHCHCHSSTSCWAFFLPQHVGNGICRHAHILSQTCKSDTRDGARIYMTDFLQNLKGHGISLSSNEFSCLLLDPCEGFCPSPSVCFAFQWDAREDDRPYRLSSEVDLPTLKFHRVRQISKIPFRNENSRRIHHTTVRRISTSMIQQSTSILEVR